MAGIFRYNTNNSTPTRRNTLSPFCTSPGQLQDVTMDNSYALGYRSPCISLQHAGSTSPGQGRSVREFEEQMASLRKENFNLKLRIYFLEEKIPGYSSSNTDGHESLLKQNVELKVDIEVLRKELQEKQSLLCEAAKAMELMELQQKATEEKSNAIIEELNQRIHLLEMENKQLEKSTNQNQMDAIMGRTDIAGDIDTIQKVRELEGGLKQHVEKTEELTAKIKEMESLIAQKDEKLKEFDDKVKQIMFQNAELQEQLDIKEKEAANSERKYNEFSKKFLQDSEHRASELASENQALYSNIEKLKAELEYEKINSDERIKKVQQQQNIMEEMQLTILTKMKATTKLSKTIEDYEKTVAELRAERKVLQREIITLKSIIVKLEHSKMLAADQQHRPVEIYLGKRESAGAETSQSRELSDRSSSSSNGTSSGNNRANPLFFAEPLQITDQNSEDNTCCRMDYKLKQKINVSISKRNTHTRNAYPHPSFYISETKNFHNSSSYPGHYPDAVQGRTQYARGVSKLSVDICRAIESINSNIVARCARSDSQQNIGALMEPNVKHSNSDTSIVSRSNLIPIPQGNLREVTKRIKVSEESINQHTKLKCTRLREELREHKIQLANKICLLEEVELKLKEQTSANAKAYKAIQKLVTDTKKLQEEIDRLKKMNSLPNLSQMKEDTYGNNSTALCRSLTDLEDARIVNAKIQEVIIEKDAEIEKLKLDMKKKRSNLLTLINEEIWRKKRQVENLTNAMKRLSISFFTSSSPTRDVDQLQQSFTDSEYSEAIECNKHLQKKIDFLIHRLLTMSESNSDEMIQQLQIDIGNARDEAEKAHRWRKEACVVLTERLEELAGFLDTLLKHKDILGALAADRSREMRKAIDRSLDISRNLNMSLSITGMSMTENSLAQLSNISGLLDISMENKENRSCTTHTKTIKDQKQLIEKQQMEIKSLKKEMSRRKIADGLKKERRSLPPNLEIQSESETWSEPDRSVSFARMGLEKSPGFSRKKDIEENKLSTSSESELDLKGKSKSQEKISQLENMISIRDGRLLEVQCELVEADNRLKQENLRMYEISHELEECKKENEMLKAEVTTYKSQLQHHDDQFESERVNLRGMINNKTAIIEKIQEERDKLTIEVRVADMKLETLKNDIDELKQKHEKNLEKAAEQEKIKLDQLQKDMVAHLEQKLKEQDEKHRDYLARDWISRVVYDEIKYDFEMTQKRYKEAQGTIEYLQENESELNKRLIENEKAMRNLKKSLDDATLQASKAVLERTKILHDKIQIEEKQQELIQKLQRTEQEKIDLGERIVQLEKSNAVLHSNLLNNSTGQYKSSKKAMSNGSDASQSGYTSEDVPLPTLKAGGQRLENSSPDLGIESDAGRASSVELTGAPNRLLKSIENLGSAENVLGEETWKLQNNGNEDDNGNNNDPITHDCAKAEKEIVELRRKLARTKRAFEDTAKKLRTSNLRKEQIERDIRQQIVKTHSVLKNVRTNMESELEQHKKE